MVQHFGRYANHFWNSDGMRYIFNFKPNEHISEINMVNLTKSELTTGCELLINSGADTYVTGKHAWISEVIENSTVFACGYSDTLSIKEILPIINTLYTYDNPYAGVVVLLEMNYCIYMDDKKIDRLACPSQMRLNIIYINDLPKALFPEIDTVQTIIANELHILLLSNGG